MFESKDLIQSDTTNPPSAIPHIITSSGQDYTETRPMALMLPPIPSDFKSILQRQRPFTLELKSLRRRAEKGEASQEEMVMYMEMFGADPHCPDWKPYRNNMARIDSLYFIKSDPVTGDTFPSLRLGMLKGYIHFQVHFFMVFDMAHCFFNTPEILYKPADGRITPYEAALTAMFRKEIVWPLFGSTEAFWIDFLDYYQEVKDGIYEWPAEEEDLSYSDIYEELLETGDLVGAKLTRMLIMYAGDWKDACRRSCKTISSLSLLFQD